MTVGTARVNTAFLTGTSEKSRDFSSATVLTLFFVKSVSYAGDGFLIAFLNRNGIVRKVSCQLLGHKAVHHRPQQTLTVHSALFRQVIIAKHTHKRLRLS